MQNLPSLDKVSFTPMSAGARYRAHLARYPERDLEPVLARKVRSIGRAIRQLWMPGRKGAT